MQSHSSNSMCSNFGRAGAVKLTEGEEMAQLERRLSRLEQQVQPEEAQEQRKPKRPEGMGVNSFGSEGSVSKVKRGRFSSKLLRSRSQGGR